MALPASQRWSTGGVACHQGLPSGSSKSKEDHSSKGDGDRRTTHRTQGDRHEGGTEEEMPETAQENENTEGVDHTTCTQRRSALRPQMAEPPTCPRTILHSPQLPTGEERTEIHRMEVGQEQDPQGDERQEGRRENATRVGSKTDCESVINMVRKLEQPILLEDLAHLYGLRVVDLEETIRVADSNAVREAAEQELTTLQGIKQYLTKKEHK